MQRWRKLLNVNCIPAERTAQLFCCSITGLQRVALQLLLLLLLLLMLLPLTTCCITVEQLQGQAL